MDSALIQRFRFLDLVQQVARSDLDACIATIGLDGLAFRGPVPVVGSGSGLASHSAGGLVKVSPSQQRQQQVRGSRKPDDDAPAQGGARGSGGGAGTAGKTKRGPPQPSRQRGGGRPNHGDESRGDEEYLPTGGAEDPHDGLRRPAPEGAKQRDRPPQRVPPHIVAAVVSALAGAKAADSRSTTQATRRPLQPRRAAATAAAAVAPPLGEVALQAAPATASAAVQASTPSPHKQRPLHGSGGSPGAAAAGPPPITADVPHGSSANSPGRAQLPKESQPLQAECDSGGSGTAAARTPAALTSSLFSPPSTPQVAEITAILDRMIDDQSAIASRKLTAGRGDAPPKSLVELPRAPQAGSRAVRDAAVLADTDVDTAPPPRDVVLQRLLTDVERMAAAEDAVQQRARENVDSSAPAVTPPSLPHAKGRVPTAMAESVMRHKREWSEHVAFNERLWNTSRMSQFVFADRITADILSDLIGEVADEIGTVLDEYVEGLADHELS